MKQAAGFTVAKVVIVTALLLASHVPAWAGDNVKLPVPELHNAVSPGAIPLDAVMQQRRSHRTFTNAALSLAQLSKLLWAGQGITSDDGRRTAPSAGALYPLDLYVVIGDTGVNGIRAGIYHYDPASHSINLLVNNDARAAVATAALSQKWAAQAPVIIVITAEYSRSTRKYRERGERYAMIEAGHAGQNILLMAESLGLGAGIIGAFSDSGLLATLHAPPTHEPLLVIPAGYKRQVIHDK